VSCSAEREGGRSRRAISMCEEMRISRVAAVLCWGVLGCVCCFLGCVVGWVLVRVAVVGNDTNIDRYATGYDSCTHPVITNTNKHASFQAFKLSSKEKKTGANAYVGLVWGVVAAGRGLC
jgi:hypothetical protein